MSDDFNRVFGARSPQQPITFTQRVGRDVVAADALGDEPGSDNAAYRAFGLLPAGGVGETCDVRRWVAGTEIAEGIEFQYRFLMQVGYVGDEQLRLMLPDCIVLIEGRHLRELRKKLARRTVCFIQQHNGRIWPIPARGEPVIEKIEMIRPEAFAVRG